MNASLHAHWIETTLMILLLAMVFCSIAPASATSVCQQQNKKPIVSTSTDALDGQQYDIKVSVASDAEIISTANLYLKYGHRGMGVLLYQHIALHRSWWARLAQKRLTALHEPFSKQVPSVPRDLTPARRIIAYVRLDGDARINRPVCQTAL